MADILVVGGAGFIGSHLVDRLLDAKHNVIVLDNLSTGKRENLNKKAKFILGDITKDFDSLLKGEKIEFVFHLAAQTSVKRSFEDPESNNKINILGTKNVVKFCLKNKVKKIIFSSTAAVYSPLAEVPTTENSKADPLSPYGKSKLEMENYLHETRNKNGLDYCCLRYSNVYGPRQDSKGEAGVIAIFIDNALSDKNIIINGDGNQTRDFVFVKDVVEANILAQSLTGIYNVSTNTETTINTLADKIIKVSKSKSKIVHKEQLKGELIKSRLSNSKIKQMGFEPKYVLDAGLKETILWFKKR